MREFDPPYADVFAGLVHVSKLDFDSCEIANPAGLEEELAKLGFMPFHMGHMLIRFASTQNPQGLTEFCNLLICLGVPFGNKPSSLLRELKRGGNPINHFWELVWDSPRAWRLSPG